MLSFFKTQSITKYNCTLTKKHTKINKMLKRLYFASIKFFTHLTHQKGVRLLQHIVKIIVFKLLPHYR